MKVRIHTLASSLHDHQRLAQYSKSFVEGIQQYCHSELVLEPTAQRLEPEVLNIIYVATGGTEQLFVQNYSDMLTLAPQHFYLLASQDNNSLAASMEILSYLENRGSSGEIIHGTAQYMASQIDIIAKIYYAKQRLSGMRLGVVGQPSDWLISSTVDETALKSKLGIQLVRIDMAELLAAMPQKPSETTKARLKTCNSPYFEGALCVYEGLRKLVEQYRLSGLTLRCFDLLTKIRNTGCLALALLNQDGVPAACEGDIPALLTMTIAQALIGQPGFQANPATLNPQTGIMVFAHCTIPLSMINDYTYDTHFESGIGVALHGELPMGNATIFKVSGMLNRYWAEDIELMENQYSDIRCRTQVLLHAKQTPKYLLSRPIANHHIILTGHQTKLLQRFFALIECKPTVI